MFQVYADPTPATFEHVIFVFAVVTLHDVAVNVFVADDAMVPVYVARMVLVVTTGPKLVPVMTTLEPPDVDMTFDVLPVTLSAVMAAC